MLPQQGDRVAVLLAPYDEWGAGIVTEDADENGEYVVEFPHMDYLGRQFTADQLRPLGLEVWT